MFIENVCQFLFRFPRGTHRFSVEVSSNGINFTEVLSGLLPDASELACADVPTHSFTLEEEHSERYVRAMLHSHHGEGPGLGYFALDLTRELAVCHAFRLLSKTYPFS